MLSGLDLPTGPGLSNQLGISGVPALSAKQIYNDRWDGEEEEAVGPGEGEDWEDEVDRELAEEDSDPEEQVKMEIQSPVHMGPREKRKRVIRRLVERPNTERSAATFYCMSAGRHVRKATAVSERDMHAPRQADQRSAAHDVVLHPWRLRRTDRSRY